MAVLLVQAMNLVRSLLNSSTIYSQNDDTERHPEQEIQDAIIAADAEIINAILTTPGHPQRRQLLSTVNVAHADLIPAHIGPIGDVLVNSKAPEQCPKEEIERLRTNPLSLTTIREYYDVSGDPPRLYFAPSGAAATVDICTFTQLSGGLRSPDEYLFPVVNTALSVLFAKEGSEMAAAGHFRALKNDTMEWIKAGSQGQPPESVAYSRAE